MLSLESEKPSVIEHSLPAEGSLEWLVGNAAGSFAMGCVDRIPRRQYHTALTVREPRHGETLNVLADVVECIEVAGESCLLAGDAYGITPYGTPVAECHAFSAGPSVQWHYRGAHGVQVRRELLIGDAADTVVLRYCLTRVTAQVTLRLFPLLRCRPWHALMQRNVFLNGAVRRCGDALAMQLYPGTPQLLMSLTGAQAAFTEAGRWCDGVHYAWEGERGYRAREDLFSPGCWTIHCDSDTTLELQLGEVLAEPVALRERTGAAALHQTSECYLMHSRSGAEAIIAGFPWFGAWGRDTMIALRGLCLTAGHAECALPILDYHASQRVNRLVPNILPVGGVPADTNALDASLLFIRAVQQTGEVLGNAAIAHLLPVVHDILDAIATGEDPRFRLEDNGLLCIAPQHGAMTWMDAQCDGHAVTPRCGFVVEINALWLNALEFVLAGDNNHPAAPRWRACLQQGRAAFQPTFWCAGRSILADAVQPGAAADGPLRPNALWALALPVVLVDDRVALAVLDAVERELLTPMGLRTLSPHDPGYCGRYAGDQRTRDRAYHNGTVWPWLLGIYADALLRYRGKDVARHVLLPVVERLECHRQAEGCIGHVSEVFDGDAPHACGGAPAQAWSLAELIHVMKVIGA